MGIADIRALTQEIEQTCNLLESYAESQHIGESEILQTRSVPRDIELARTKLASLSDTLHNNASPYRRLTEIRTQIFFNACLRFVLHFRLHKHVPLEGHASFDELIKLTGVDGVVCTRILRAGIGMDLFSETQSGIVRHSLLTRRLVEDELLVGRLEARSTELSPALEYLVPGVSRWNAEDHTTSLWNQYNKTDLHLFRYLESYPERSRNFARSMQANSERPETSSIHLVNGYKWKDLGSAKMVDIGGSTGMHSKALGEEFPQLNIIVQDLSGAIGGLTENTGGSRRITFMVHDFFLPQPVQDADVYLLRWILHDHADNDALEILHNVASVMKPDARILVMDRVVQPWKVYLTPEDREAR